MSAVAVVTDSTCYLDAAERQRWQVTCVPLQVVVGGRAHDEDRFASDELARSMQNYVPVSTSRPSPMTFLDVYAAAAAAGAPAVVSVHLSAQLSGTVQAAELAARSAPVPVLVVDSRQLGLALGFAVTAAARTALGGGGAEEVAAAARVRAAATRTYFYVDTLEHLRRGGRVNAAQALIGTALSVKPLLQVDDGRVVPIDKVRTTSRALARLEDLSAQAAAGGGCDIAVQHLACPDRASEFADRLARRLRAEGVEVASMIVREVGAVVGAHVGPGMLAVAVAPA